MGHTFDARNIEILSLYMLNIEHVKNDVKLCPMSFICSLKFLLFHLIGHTKRCLQKNIENFLSLSFCDMTVSSKSNIPVTLINEGKFCV